MALKIKIGKADHEKLSDELKTLYIPDGDNFKLDADYEDVTGLKAKTAELLADLKAQKALVAKYGDLDPDVAKAALDAAKKADDEKLKAEGDFETLRKKLEERHAAELQTATAKEQSLLTNLKRERLQNYLVEKGVLADRAAYAFVDVGEQIELASDDQGFSLKLKGGIGDAKELETVVESLKAKSPFLFESTNASGSGASGSSNGSGASALKTLTKAQVAELGPAAKRDFYINDGVVSDA